MTQDLTKEGRRDLLSRGYSRRNLGRIAALLTMDALAIPAIFPHLVNAASAAEHHGHERPDLSGMVRIGTNECWTGPFSAAIKAGQDTVPLGNRYEPGHLRRMLIENVAAVEGLDHDCILPWPGSSDPLARAVVTFCSPSRGLVTADPTFESCWRVADWLGAKATRVPLTPANGYRIDVRAMLNADPHAGLYYVCSPNNPTGVVTPVEDIEWLVKNRPAGSAVLIDEAYLHFAGTRSAAYLVRDNPDVVVLRTFSKLFGMAGLRLGLSFAQPDTHQKMMRYDGQNQSGTLSVVALACGAASVTDATAIAARRAEMIAAREETFAYLKARNLRVIPSQANMFMVDWGRPAASMKALFASHNIDIGRAWPIWPNVSRITVGSAAEMKQFCDATGKLVT